MINTYFSIILAAFLINAYDSCATPIITMFLVPYPHDCTARQLAINKLSHPGKLAKYTLQNKCNAQTIIGILATYSGFIGFSDTNGELTFPRKHEATSLTVVVTPVISPAIMHGNTISHWELDATKPCAVYSFERIRDDAHNLTFWQAKEVEPFPDCKIPITALIIIADPAYVYVPLGVTPTELSANLLLPDIYVKYGIKTIQSDLYYLNIIHFFGPLQKTIRQGTTDFSQITGV
jgi:hypothetical protein